MLGLGSIKYPVISSIGGVIWLIGRIVFFQVWIKFLFLFLNFFFQRVMQLVNLKNVVMVHLLALDYI
jgi:hypothetical protein